jgi:MFS family permease
MTDSRESGPPDFQPTESRPKGRLFTRNFILLLQGQFVSALGDQVYSIALGFWVLSVTGSTALMGTLMAASALPRVLVSPFAGVIIDRSDRKWTLVTMDAIRGGAVVFVGIAAFSGFIEIWMVFAVAVILGTCGAFFNPAVGSSVPDIVPKSKIVRANSFFSMIYTGTGIVGGSAGGFLYAILGAPLMFLINGLSYLFSAVTELFIQIPRVVHQVKEFRFFQDMKEGYRFVWRIRGLRFLILVAAVSNFFAVIGIVLFLPLFERTESLGPGLYGLFMACFTAGYFAGTIFTSARQFRPDQRFQMFVFGITISSLLLTPISLIPVFPIMAALVLVGGFFNAIVNIFISSIIQVATPGEMRGKVISLLSTVAGGLSPLAMALGGTLAEFLPIRILIASAFGTMLLFIIPLFFSDAFRRFINFDPETDTLESIS